MSIQLSSCCWLSSLRMFEYKWNKYINEQFCVGQKIELRIRKESEQIIHKEMFYLWENRRFRLGWMREEFFLSRWEGSGICGRFLMWRLLLHMFWTLLYVHVAEVLYLIINETPISKTNSPLWLPWIDSLQNSLQAGLNARSVIHFYRSKGRNFYRAPKLWWFPLSLNSLSTVRQWMILYRGL